MSEHRIARLEEQVREEIAKMISMGRIKDKDVQSFLSINKVWISKDLAYAKVYVSSFMKERETKKGVVALERASGFIRSSLSHSLHIRKMPHLTFIYDSSIKDGQRMIRLIDSLNIETQNECMEDECIREDNNAL